MNFCVALVILAQQKPKKLSVGADIATIGKIRPGTYLAERDLQTLPKIKDLGQEKWPTFSGNVYILPSDKSQDPEIVIFVQGRKRTFNKEKGVAEYGPSLYDYLSSLNEKADVRVATASFVSFTVTLPTDYKKLAGFDGTITFSGKNMKSEDILTITLKKGKVVATMP